MKACCKLHNALIAKMLRLTRLPDTSHIPSSSVWISCVLQLAVLERHNRACNMRQLPLYAAAGFSVSRAEAAKQHLGQISFRAARSLHVALPCGKSCYGGRRVTFSIRPFCACESNSHSRAPGHVHFLMESIVTSRGLVAGSLLQRVIPNGSYCRSLMVLRLQCGTEARI